MKWIYTCFLLTVSYLAPAQVEKILLGQIGDAGFKRIEIRPVLCGMRGASLNSGINPVYTAPKVIREMSGLELRLHRSRYADTSVKRNLQVVQPAMDTATGVRYRLRCGSGFPGDSREPLLVIDGNIADSLGQLNSLDISTISDITVLQAPAAQALFGHMAMNGAIVVSIKPSPKRIIKVMDATDGKPLPGATVRMESTDGGRVFQYMTDETGYLFSKDWLDMKAWRVTVTATGYLPFYKVITRAGFTEKIIELNLSRNVITCPGGVVVMSRLHRSRGCGGRGVAIRQEEMIMQNEQLPASSCRVFPNPARRGGTVSFRFISAIAGPGQLSLHGADGRLIISLSVQLISGENKVRLPVSNTWSAGMYFVRLHYANGRIAASEQVIIQ